MERSILLAAPTGNAAEVSRLARPENGSSVLKLDDYTEPLTLCRGDWDGPVQSHLILALSQMKLLGWIGN